MGLGLAEAILRELAGIGLANGGVRPLAVAILRETRMPAVQVELGVAANTEDAARLCAPAFADEAAAAMATGIERFLERAHGGTTRAAAG
jgi:N-acetylmuramoyl-L-alanine amidase